MEKLVISRKEAELIIKRWSTGIPMPNAKRLIKKIHKAFPDLEIPSYLLS